MVTVRKKAVTVNTVDTTEVEFDEILWRSNQEKNNIALFIELLNGIGKLLNSSVYGHDYSTDHHTLYYEELTENNYYETLQNQPSQLDDTDMKKFLSQMYGEKHPEVIRWLSGIAQLVVVSTLGKVAAAIIHSKIPIQPKDVRGSWSVEFRVYEPGVDEDGCRFGILHQRSDCFLKKESPSIMRPMYNFKWQVEIKFQSQLMDKVSAVSVRLLDIDWSVYDPLLKLTEEEKQEMQDMCIRFFSTEKANSSPGVCDKTRAVQGVDSVLVELTSCTDFSKEPERSESPKTNAVSTPTTPEKKNKHGHHLPGWLSSLQDKILTSRSASSEDIFEALQSYNCNSK